MRGRCKGCGASLLVPPPSPPRKEERIVIRISGEEVAAPPAAGQTTDAGGPPPLQTQRRRRTSVRERRLRADAQLVVQAFRDFDPIQVLETIGEPPEIYRIRYRVRGLERGPDGEPTLREEHVAEIQLTRDYPRQAPKCKMLTPIFHPNIEPAAICVGDHWTAGERLSDLIIRIGQMIAYQAYNIKSPLDGEAAMWADLNQHKLPIDSRDLYPPDY